MMKPMVNKKMRQSDTFEYYLIKKVGKTIKKFNLIEEGDRVLVGVSGGKDSLTLLKLLHDRRGFYPNQYELLALHVVSSLRCEGATDPHVLEDYLREKGYPYLFVRMISSMLPYQELFGGRLAIIRPLYHIPESDTRKFARLYGFPVASCRCPVDREMQRELFKRLLCEIERANPRAGVNALRSLEHVNEEYLPGRLIREDVLI